ncbi:unnamed protein product [Sphenostylis stenocarpa]|uniref:Uncharacterized protein n=1 Tax=Sphenostylis stenocarpa TaxID=92480 RepID=A0AA86VWW2_9FABA|nr:unnamed protein product [Sphenostylis stenocarpa]
MDRFEYTSNYVMPNQEYRGDEENAGGGNVNVEPKEQGQWIYVRKNKWMTNGRGSGTDERKLAIGERRDMSET